MPVTKHELEKALIITPSMPENADDFLLEVDHIFICATEGLQGVAVLQEFGLHCHEHTVRRVGQGTASTIIFFENTYLELISIEDENAVEQNVARTGIDILARAHWRHTGASPFGIGLRGKSDTAELMPQDEKHWSEGMRPDVFIHFAPESVASVEEPMCFVIPDSLALTTWLDCSCEAHQRLISHPLGVKKLTGIKIIVNSAKELTDATFLLSHNGVVAIEQGTSPLLELTFDGGTRGKILDARPTLPILLKY